MALSRFVQNPSVALLRFVAGGLAVLLVVGPALFGAVAPCPRSASQAAASPEALPTTAPVNAARHAVTPTSHDAAPLFRCVAPLLGRLTQLTTTRMRPLERGSELRPDGSSALTLYALASSPREAHVRRARTRGLDATATWPGSHTVEALRSIVLLL